MYVDQNTGEPIMMGGEIMRPASQRDAGVGFNQAKDLRAAYDKQNSEVVAVTTAYRKIENAFAEDSGAGDIAGIFGFMKALDPTSTVREGEAASAENSAGVSETWRNLYNKALKGERLSPTARKQMLSAASSQMRAYRPRYDETRKTYTDLANSFGVEPDQVVTPLEWPRAPTDEVFQPLPAGGMGQTGPGIISSATAAPATPARAPVSAKKIISDVFGD
jgi:hypothetical protein